MTCPDTLAPFYVSLAVHEPGAVTAETEYRKTLKYTVLSSSYSFASIVVETLGVIWNEARHFLTGVAQHIEKESDDRSGLQHLLQCIVVTAQQGNAVKVLGTLN